MWPALWFGGIGKCREGQEGGEWGGEKEADIYQALSGLQALAGVLGMWSPISQEPSSVRAIPLKLQQCRVVVHFAQLVSPPHICQMNKCLLQMRKDAQKG